MAEKLKSLRVLVGCEESQVVTKAFRELGHEAYSCDLLPCSGGHPEWHIQDDVLKHLNDGWDIGIFHPECTFLTVAGARWFYHPDDKKLPVEKRRPHPQYPHRKKDQEKAAKFFMKLYNAKIPRVAVENPIGVMSRLFRKPDQILQPWQYGSMECKSTCLWLKNLPLLKPTKIVYEEMMKLPKSQREKVFYMAPSADRSRLRSTTYLGIGKAMAEQWGSLS